MSYTIETAIYALMISFSASVILCIKLIPLLTKLKYGQMVRDDGPQAHLKKAGTPTMGGIVIILALIIGSALFLRDNKDGLLVLTITVLYAIVGFLDDYIKVVKKRSLGLRAYQKMAAQILITIIFAIYIYRFSDIGTAIFIPFNGGFYLELGIWFLPFLFFAMVGTVNGVNFTDGLDGLASGVTALVTMFFLFMALSLNTNLVPILGAAVGSLLGFLLFNSHPAKVFMGDTGSLALGGLIATVAIMLKLPILIVVVGIIYVLEVFSVMLQVAYFKLTKGKRLFKMAPLHHHFELMGWAETKVVTLFYITTAIACLIGFLITRTI